MAIRKKNGVYWLENAWFPFNIGFIADAKSWDKFSGKFLKLEESYPDTAGRCQMLKDENGHLLIIITIQEWEERPIYEIAGLVAHECSHALDFLCEHIGESTPSEEFAAYTIQSFVTDIMEVIVTKRNKK